MIRNFRLSRLKPYFSFLETLPPSRNPKPLLLQQQCPVSGTAKGKAKLKTGQPLKRSKIPKKKGSKSGSESSGRSHEASDRFDKMVDACLNAPSPIRHLTPKQKEREAEREKLGLISKARQREIDEMKAKAKAESKEKKSETPVQESPAIALPGLDLFSLGLVDVEKIPKYELTVEDGRRLAKEYSRVLMRQTRERQAAEMTLLRLKKEAIQALPENLRAAATMVPDLTPFPANRFVVTLTPPIEGYSEMINEAAKKNIGKEKRR